jgi:hypothetical protein
LLKSVLALPLVRPSANAAVVAQEAPMQGNGSGALFSGLPGLDYALGGIGPGKLSCVKGPPCMGKTLLLLELAARLVNRYGQNVLFYSAHKPSVYIAKKAQIRGDARVIFAEESVDVEARFDSRTDQAAIHLLDSSSADLNGACAIASRLRDTHPAGCAGLILDGWNSYRERGVDFVVVDAVPQYPAERCDSRRGGSRLQRLHEVLRSIPDDATGRREAVPCRGHARRRCPCRSSRLRTQAFGGIGSRRSTDTKPERDVLADFVRTTERR